MIKKVMYRAVGFRANPKIENYVNKSEKCMLNMVSHIKADRIVRGLKWEDYENAAKDFGGYPIKIEHLIQNIERGNRKTLTHSYLLFMSDWLGLDMETMLNTKSGAEREDVLKSL